MPSSDNSPTISASPARCPIWLEAAKHGDRDRQVVGRPAPSSRSAGARLIVTLDDGTLPPLLRIAERYPLPALLDRRVRQTDDDHAGLPEPNIDLDLDKHAVEPDNGATKDLREHARRPSWMIPSHLVNGIIQRKWRLHEGARRIIAAPFSPTMIDGAWVFPLINFGMIEASITRSPSRPWTRSCVSTTARSSWPILQEPTGW